MGAALAPHDKIQALETDLEDLAPSLRYTTQTPENVRNDRCSSVEMRDRMLFKTNEQCDLHLVALFS